jgi:hypothetical protein
MISVQGTSALDGIKVATKDFGGFTTEEVAERALDKIIQVGDQSHPLVREQAIAFRNHIREVLVFYMNEAVKFDRVTLAYKLREAGHPELIKLLEGA